MRLESTTVPSVSPYLSPAERAAILASFPPVRLPAEQRVQATVLYARESDPDKQDSNPFQLSQDRVYAIRHGLPEIIREYQDSQTGLDPARPDYMAMLAAAERGEFSHLVLWESQRFGRDDREFINAMYRLLDLGVAIHDTREGHLTADDVARLAWEANRESRRNSRRTREHQLFHASQGIPMTRLPVGLKREYDYDDKGDKIKPGRVVIDPVAGPAVRKCMLDYAAGASRRAVTDDLNSTLGLNMAPSSVGKLMKNRLLMGIYVWGRESCSRLTGRKPCPQEEWQTARVPMPETLVDEATFEAVQARLKANTRTGYDCPDGRGDLLQGFLWCACGSRMFGHTARRGTPRQSTEYRCERCYHGRSMKKIDQTAVAIMADHGLPIVLNLPVAVEEPTGPDGGEDDRLRQLREQDAQLTAERVALTRQFSRGEIEAADYHATIRVADGERRQVRDAIARAEQEHRQRQSQRVLVKRMVQQWKQDGEYERYCFAGKEEARQAFTDFVERITFDRAADTLTVMWKAWLVDAPDDQTVTKPVGYLSELRPDRWRLGPQ